MRGGWDWLLSAVKVHTVGVPSAKSYALVNLARGFP
jgi:hypothetical protein